MLPESSASAKRLIKKKLALIVKNGMKNDKRLVKIIEKRRIYLKAMKKSAEFWLILGIGKIY